MFEARCQAVVRFNGIVKILLTVESHPNQHDEHVLLNLLRGRVDFEQGDIVEITIKKKP
jgi:hypothetical protein